MASKKAKTNGHDSVTADMLVVLQQIARGVAALREDVKTEIGELRADMKTEIGELRGELGELREEVRGLRADLKSYQRQTDAQISAVAHDGADTGTSVVDLRERVARLEEAVFKKTGS